MSTLYITHPACLDHQTPFGHPERPDRIRAIERALEIRRTTSTACATSVPAKGLSASMRIR
jgi:acetoin utilization deacetylase AcuC-like enzyme